MSLNKVQLIGRLGKDPDTHTFDSGMQKVSFPLATTERWKDKNTGERKERTEWHNIIIMHAGLTNIAQNYLKQGSRVYLEGRLKTSSWDDVNSGQKRYKTEIVVDNLIMLDAKVENSNQNQSAKSAQTTQQPQMIERDMPEDDLRF